MTRYIGIVRDDLDTLPDHKTKTFKTYFEAHTAAEDLCKKTYGDRGSIDVLDLLVKEEQ